MTKEPLYDVWWKKAGESEQIMEDGHAPHWKKVLDAMLEKDLSKCSVLDIGCNQGGFLRYLYARRPFQKGLGIDLATQSVAVANGRRGDLPLSYFATGEPQELGEQFDLAVSISVIYLIRDLRGHAQKVRGALKPGGVYYTSFADYNGNPSFPRIKRQIDENGATPLQMHTLDDIANAFFDEGFDVSLRRLVPTGYVPLTRPDPWYDAISHRMLYEYEQGYIFRMEAPGCQAAFPQL